MASRLGGSRARTVRSREGRRKGLLDQHCDNSDERLASAQTSSANGGTTGQGAGTQCPSGQESGRSSAASRCPQP